MMMPLVVQTYTSLGQQGCDQQQQQSPSLLIVKLTSNWSE